MALPIGTHTVDQATGQPPRRRYRRLWTVSLPSGNGTLRIAPGAQLQAEFLPLTFNALASGAAIPASRTNQGGGVRISLDLPLRLHRVVFAGGISGTITVHRVDGSAIAEQATTTVDIDHGQITLAQDFRDRTFVLKRPGTPLTTGHITELWFISYPTTPQFGLLDETADPATVIPLWLAPEQLTVSNAQSRLTLATPEFQPLERFLAGKSLSTLGLVADSDQPCRLQITTASLSYRRTYQGFTPNAPEPAKQVLRFQGGDLEPKTLSLTLPPQVQVAALEMSLSLNGAQRSADALASATQTPPTSRQGLELLPQQWGGLPFTPATATRYSGVTLGLMLLRPHTTLTVNLRTNDDSLPGESLTQATLTTLDTAQPQWITLRFPEPVVLYSQSYWLLVGASEPALWLTQPVAGDVYLLERSPQALWASRQHYLQTQALHQFLEPAIAPSPKDSKTAGNHPALSLQIANTTLPTQWEPERDRVTVNLLAGLPFSSTSTIVDISIATTTPGFVTIYPPTIEYVP